MNHSKIVQMSEISNFIKQEADWLFNEEVGHIEPENFDAVYECITGDFRLGAIAMASQMKNLFELVSIDERHELFKVIKYLDDFINHEIVEVERGRKYL